MLETTNRPVIDYEALAARMGEETLSRRLQAQTHLSAKLLSARTGWFNADNLYGLNSILRTGLKLTGLTGKGETLFRNIQVYHQETFFADLPPAFDGFTILQMSDLHLDGDPFLSAAIIEKLQSVGHYDLCALTGDYRFKVFGSPEACLQELRSIFSAVDAPIYAVLGNHDDIEMAPRLEELGSRVLLNETVPLERDGEQIHLVGVDDPHYYKTMDIKRATRSICPESFKVLLVHSPEAYEEAAQASIQYLMCGHTHAGQVCLPGEIPILLNADCPRKYGCGYWEHGQLKGYTSRGTGGSGVAVRFFCPPEITVHRLRRKRNG